MKTRFRIGYEGIAIKREVLVLQILKPFAGEIDSYGWQSPDCERWVDAKLEDITEGFVPCQS